MALIHNYSDGSDPVRSNLMKTYISSCIHSCRILDIYKF